MEKIFLNTITPVLSKKKEKSLSSIKISPVKWNEASKKTASSREKNKVDSEVEGFEEKEALDNESPMALFSSLQNNQSKHSPKKESKSETCFEPAKSQIEEKGKEPNEDEAKAGCFLPVEKVESSFGIEPVKIASTPKTTFQVKLQLLAEKLLSKLQVMKSTGKTEICLTFKQSNTLFSGAKLSLTEFDSAKGEFRILFEHLSPKAHALIINPVNQDMLKESLMQKGFIFHYIEASTDEIYESSKISALLKEKEKDGSSFSDGPDEEEA